MSKTTQMIDSLMRAIMKEAPRDAMSTLSYLHKMASNSVSELKASVDERQHVLREAAEFAQARADQCWEPPAADPDEDIL